MRIRSHLALCLAAWLLASLPGQTGPSDPLAGFGAYPGMPPARYSEFTLSTHLVRMRDGVRLAVDVILPAGGDGEETFPALVRVTRTWRSLHEAVPGPEERFFARYGYAFVKVDARGSGASFGSRPAPWSPEELADGSEILRWVASQPWSDGRIGAIGQGYDGSAAELLAAAAPDLCRAVYSRFSVHDAYQEWFFPGGMLAVGPLAAWTEAMAALDRNRWPFASDGTPLGVRPLDEDVAESLLGEALTEHQANLPLLPSLARVHCRDDRLGPSDLTVDRISPHRSWPALVAAGTPLLLWAGWHDAATAAGVLRRFQSGGGEFRAAIGPEVRLYQGLPGQSGFRPEELVEYEPTGEWAEALRFFDRHVRGLGGRATKERVLFYYTLGEGKWKATEVWPPKGTEFRALFPDPRGGLNLEPEAERSAQPLSPEPTATRGPDNRWRTGDFTLGVRQGVRIQEAGPRLIWLGAPLEKPLEITGTPVAHLWIASSAPDAGLFLYLDVLNPAGALSYVSEGVLRAGHRRAGTALSPGEVPSRSFLRKDLLPLKPGEPILHSFSLQPISVRVPAGHRLRLSLAGVDVGTFPPPSREGAPELVFYCGGEQPSRLELPLVPVAGAEGGR